MFSVSEFAKLCLEKNFNCGGTYVDFTMGNGNDTLWLAKKAAQGVVYSFDIQEIALIRTRELLDKDGVCNVNLINSSHSKAFEYVDGLIDGGIFNLGYLPQGDKSITTQTDTTVTAVKLAVSRLKPSGVIAIVLYVGHDGGADEAKAVEQEVNVLDTRIYNVVKFSPMNKSNPPYVIVIERAI